METWIEMRTTRPERTGIGEQEHRNTENDRLPCGRRLVEAVTKLVRTAVVGLFLSKAPAIAADDVARPPHLADAVLGYPDRPGYGVVLPG